MGTARDDGSQQAMWVAMADLPQGGGHPFYERLNKILGAAGFDAFVEQLCAQFCSPSGLPASPPDHLTLQPDAGRRPRDLPKESGVAARGTAGLLLAAPCP